MLERIAPLIAILGLCICSPADAVIVWTGAVDGDPKNDANYDFGGSSLVTVAGIDVDLPNTDPTLMDDLRFTSAGTTPVLGENDGVQERWGVNNAFNVTFDGVVSALTSGANDGWHAGTASLINGAQTSSFYWDAAITLDGTSSLALLGGGAPLTPDATVDMAPGASIHFTNETVADFNTEHLNKLSVNGIGLVAGLNATVASDGGTGTIVTATTLSGPLLVVNQQTGQVTLMNGGPSIANIIGYAIRSTAGGLDSADWNRQSEGTQLASDNDDWTILENDSQELGEMVLVTTGDGDGGTLGSSTDWDFGEVWMRTPYRDVAMELLLDDGQILRSGTDMIVVYQGNDIPAGDLTGDGQVTLTDWAAFKAAFGDPIAATSAAGRYLASDMNGDGQHTLADVLLFEQYYDANNTPGAFAALAGTSVPEPATWLPLLFCGALLAGRRTWRNSTQPQSRRGHCRMKLANPPFGKLSVLLMASIGIGYSSASAEIVAYWPIEEPSGTTTADVANGANDSTNGASFVTSGLASIPSGTTSALDYGSATSAVGANFDGILGSTARTISAWVQVADGADSRSTIISWGSSFAGTTPTGYLGGRNTFLVDTDGQLRFEIGGGFVKGSATVNDGMWHHVVMRSAEGNTDTQNVEFYIDGTSDSVSTFGNANPINSNLGHGGIGVTPTTSSGSASTLSGLLDEVRIYNEVVSIADTLADITVAKPLNLLVNTVTGVATIENVNSLDVDFGTPDVDLRGYTIAGSSGAFSVPGSFATTTSLQAQLGNDNDTDGLGFEIVSASDTHVSEYDLLGTGTMLTGSTSISLGAIYDTANAVGNLSFSYVGLDDVEVVGTVEYFTPSVIGGDYNGDGVVNIADYTVWRNNLGANVSLNGENPSASTPGVVDQEDYAYWKASFGNSAASAAVQATTVPEPSSVGVLVFAVFGGTLVRTRRVLHFTKRGVACVCVTAIVAWVVLGSTTLAAVTNDRVYEMGEGAAGEGGSVPENGIAGNIVGSGVSVSSAGDTVDSQGPSMAYLGLNQLGSPVYANVTTGPYQRVGATGGDTGILFDGTDDLLSSPYPLNRPDELQSLLPTGTNYPLNYDGITARGAQLWVYPDQASLGTGRQVVLMDTIAAGGVVITADGNWTQINDGHASDTDIPATVPVVGDQWHHVMHHIYRSGDPGAPNVVPGTGLGELGFTGVVYVNGVAVSANNDTPAPGDLYVGNRTGRLVVGAEEVSGDGITPAYDSYFSGVLDNLDMYVYGDNSAMGGQNYGTFDLFTDNAWIAEAIAALPGSTLKVGDLDKDGVVTLDDADDFLAGWRNEKILTGAHNAVTVGDWLTWEQGDLNHDGVTDFADAYLMHVALEDAGLGGLDFAALGNSTVPEPATIVLVMTSMAVLWRFKRIL